MIVVILIEDNSFLMPIPFPMVLSFHWGQHTPCTYCISVALLVANCHGKGYTCAYTPYICTIKAHKNHIATRKHANCEATYILAEVVVQMFLSALYEPRTSIGLFSRVTAVDFLGTGRWSRSVLSSLSMGLCINLPSLNCRGRLQLIRSFLQQQPATIRGSFFEPSSQSRRFLSWLADPL